MPPKKSINYKDLILSLNKNKTIKINEELSRSNSTKIITNKDVMNLFESIHEKLDKLENNNKLLLNKVQQLEKKAKNDEPKNHVNTEIPVLIKQINKDQTFIDGAAELGINLDVDFMQNGINLLDFAELNLNHPNSYGTKLMDYLFTIDEMANSIFEKKSHSKSKRQLLNPIKINLIKACYYVKYNNKQNFIRNWPLIGKSLNQKCYDMFKKRNQKQNLKSKRLQYNRKNNKIDHLKNTRESIAAKDKVLETNAQIKIDPDLINQKDYYLNALDMVSLNEKPSFRSKKRKEFIINANTK